jgi:hypothetical protein
MKKVWMTAVGLAATLMGATALSSMAIAQAETSIPKVRVSSDRTQLQLRWDRQRYFIDAADLTVQVLDAVDCEAADLRERQVFSGQWFFPESVSVDPMTGNVAVGVLLQECLGTQTSAVFVIDPQPRAYSIYRVQVPGNRPLLDEFTTFPLSSIVATGFVGRDLAVRHADASDSEAMLIFQESTTPAGEFVACVYTRFGESDRLCPQ